MSLDGKDPDDMEQIKREYNEIAKALDEVTNEILDDLIETKGGKPVLMNTSECVVYHIKRNSCKGCPNSLPCAKHSYIKKYLYKASLYTPQNFEDYEKTDKIVRSVMYQILECTSIPEIKKILDR